MSELNVYSFRVGADQPPELLLPIGGTGVKGPQHGRIGSERLC